MNKTIDLGIAYNYNKYKANFIIMSAIKNQGKGCMKEKAEFGKGWRK